MLDQPQRNDTRIAVAEVETCRVALGAVAHWFGPWLLAGVLTLIVIAGLWCASRAADGGTYAIGITAAALAFVALIWELVAGVNDRPPLPLGRRWLVEDGTSLVILATLLMILVIGGLVLAARSDSPAAQGAGYGMFVFGIVFIFISLRHYFDRRAGGS